MSLLARRRAMMNAQKEDYPVLPAGYKRVQYIRKTARGPLCYFGLSDKPFKNNDLMVLRSTLDHNGATGAPGSSFINPGVIGISGVSNAEDTAPWIKYSDEGLFVCNRFTAQTATYGTPDILEAKISIGAGAIDYATGLYIGDYRNGIWQTAQWYGDFYGISFERNGQKYIDIWPCYRESDDVTGVYDIVHQTFKSCAGTRGPEV